jgi:hypothetical protein
VAETLEGDRQEHLQTVPVQAGPYSFDVTPVGWSVQGHRPGSVTFAADDGTSDPHPDAFVGKIVLLYDTDPLFGEAVAYSGRDFKVNESSDTLVVSTRTRVGEPEGTVRLQVPLAVGWSVDTALEMLDGVRVSEGAVAPESDPHSVEEVPGGLLIGD